eukprot:CAMPEP_0168164138 /NCGR_PEP_ID=MMETSP0139_2-20121125/768_1 /TAXON_ID=44445 /ORGANISM="Pseudo-nitzschia australis, Strain 10249 10 AB" /LENGTH=387 /DNA_ID=CAMNT_0008081117 /DNA_START=364 /DNA_END=1527 /DNA_ORIENTATION=+
MEQFSVVTDDDDESSSFSSDNTSLNYTFKSSIPGFSRSWTSVGARCPVSGAIVHFCSTGDLDDAPAEEIKEQQDHPNTNTPFALLGITDSVELEPPNYICEAGGDSSEVEVAIRKFRNLLASRLNEGTALNRTLLNLKCSMNGSLTTKDLLRNISHDGLPLLSVPKRSSDSDLDDAFVAPRKEDPVSSTSTFLKEIVVPHFDYAAYGDGSTLVSKLALAPTKRPAVGVYQWPDSTTCIRPLPTASEDSIIPSPSLIFHCESPEDATRIRNCGFREAKIGYGGLGPGHGQVMLLHKDILGLDVRYCPRTTISSAFSEAQESLLAGSLEELQSTNVLVSGREEAKSDVRVGNSDCWVEVRANLKRPSKFFRRSKKRKQKIANIPDLPYE